MFDHVPNQREIASLLGISQATISRALRGDGRISPELRRTVLETAARLGYRSNAYVNVLMSHIRSGKKISEKGVIALLVDAYSLEDWHTIGTFRGFHQGVLRRAEELGFQVENFLLQAQNWDTAKIDSILFSRGIQGVILAPPYRGNRALNMRWDRYAAVGAGFGWAKQELDRVAFDNLQSINTAYDELVKRGYTRIGTSLPESFTTGNFRGIKWFAGYMECKNRLPYVHRIPLCRIPSSIKIEDVVKMEDKLFRQWFEKWRPDAVLTINGFEIKCMEAMGLKIPRDVGLASLAAPFRPEISGIDEKPEVVGATALEWVASKIARNEFGLPKDAKVMMVEGVWRDGKTVREWTA